MKLRDRVLATIRRHDLVRPGMRVAVALSGGPDSVALTLLLRSLEEEGALVLVGLAHLNHGLRDEAAADATFCRAFASSLSLPIEVGSADVRGRAGQERTSIEAAAHAERYEFLAAAAARLGADRVALGHTLDDQAETVLLRLLRGAGTNGLAAMHPRHGAFIRPLLGVRRQDLRAFLDASGQPFVEDGTNADLEIPRNRVRVVLLPLLECEFNPRIVEVLSDEADLAREEWRWLRAAAEALIHESVRHDGASWTLKAAAFCQAPLAVARAALRLLMEQAAAGRPVALRHVTTVLDLCGREEGAADLPGHRVERVADTVVLTSRQGEPGRPGHSRPGPNFFAYPLSIPGEARIPEAQCTVSAEIGTPDDATRMDGTRRTDTAVVALQACEPPLGVRSRRPGDRLTLAGGGGRKKVQDLLVDRKVAREMRDAVPIVVDARDRIVWVAGHGIGGEFRVTDSAQAVIILRLKLWGEPA
jgi:tRNA(Ile)-lysidine synthase